MKYLKADTYDVFGGLVFFAPIALLVRTQAGISEGKDYLDAPWRQFSSTI